MFLWPRASCITRRFIPPKQSQYGDIPSDILPGVEVKGVLVFSAVGTPVPQTGAVALHLEASSENYMANFRRRFVPDRSDRRLTEGGETYMKAHRTATNRNTDG